MIGAIIGDIVGSRFEWHNHKSKDFELFHHDCDFTDDTVMTFAVAKALLDYDGDPAVLSEKVTSTMQDFGRAYQHRGYGGNFGAWIWSHDPKPYGSYGNGAAMRVSPVAYVARTAEDVRVLSNAVTCPTHDHPEGIKGAEATAMCVWLALHAYRKDEIKDYVTDNYYPIIKHITLDSIRPKYKFDVSCQGSVPQAILAFLESNSFEDAIRNAISIGGDSDTIAAITGSIAEAYYRVPRWIEMEALGYLPHEFHLIYEAFPDDGQ